MHKISVNKSYRNAAGRGVTAKKLVACQLALAMVFSLGSVSEASTSSVNPKNDSPVMPAVIQHNEDSYEKRSAPKEVPPVVSGEVEYVVIHFAFKSGAKQNGGYIEARDKKTGKKLWGMQVYTTNYDQNLEKDVQDVFITEMVLDAEKGVLLITDEKHRTYSVDIKTQQVEVLKK